MSEMAAQDSLDSGLHLHPVSINTKCEIINQLWQINVHPLLLRNGEINCDSYFEYYIEQCSLALHDGGRHNSVRTHRDILNIAQYLRMPLERDHIRRILREKLPEPRQTIEDDQLDNAIDLVARLLLMVQVGGFQYGFSGQRQLVWTTSSLENFVGAQFSSAPTLKHEQVKLEKIFKARNIERIAGIEIVWTHNLADHLRMTEEDKKVAIFHYASFLECQQARSTFPRGLIEETLRTFALLFPQSDIETKKWFRKLPSSLNLDNKLIKCGHLRVEDRQIEKFEFWHDRLVMLKQAFDEAEPSTLSQWWYDRRKGVQWYTFWVAVLVLALTIFFGVIQCVEGALQAYKAFVPTT